MIKFKRLEKLQKNITIILNDSYKVINATIVESSALGMSNAYYKELYQYQWFSNLAFVPLNDNLLKFAVTGNVIAWSDLSKKIKDMVEMSDYVPSSGTLSSLLNDVKTDALKDIRKAVNIISSSVSSVSNGQNVSQDVKF